MTSAAENHVDHSKSDTWTRWQRGRGDDRQERWSVVSNQVTTDRSGGREVGGQITQNGDRWSVAKWPPADQFSDARLEAERDKRINTD